MFFSVSLSLFDMHDFSSHKNIKTKGYQMGLHVDISQKENRIWKMKQRQLKRDLNCVQTGTLLHVRLLPFSITGLN